MVFTFRPAVRSNVQLLIGLAGGTGSGKTWSAMELAVGLSGGKPFGFVDTERGRALHYAPPEGQKAVRGESFDFHHGFLEAPFRPMAYLEAIKKFESANYPVIVIDSMSHEHAGEGGLLDWHDELLEEFVERAQKSGDSRADWQLRDAHNMRAWIEPKAYHKRFLQHLLQLQCHLILCFRAESKTEIVKDEKGKTQIRPKESLIGLNGMIPVCEKNIPYEMTLSFMLTAENPGIPLPIKLEAQHRSFVPLDKKLDREVGEKLAEWASGQTRKKPDPMTMTAAIEFRSIMSAIELAEKPEHIVALKPRINELLGDERKIAINTGAARIKELKQ